MPRNVGFVAKVCYDLSMTTNTNTAIDFYAADLAEDSDPDPTFEIVTDLDPAVYLANALNVPAVTLVPFEDRFIVRADDTDLGVAFIDAI